MSQLLDEAIQDKRELRLEYMKNMIKKLFFIYWQHEDTGYIGRFPFWKRPSKRWYRIKKPNA